ncbi:MAG: GIY-YIG nuclease family protein [Anaerolineae bacterium]|nr:GIY-YIG nuclease family protein [Anaerolineae bacterium]MDW8069422.1 GIY-YIG nuclease family protein [Anaerolineae bacterium]
MEEPQRVRVGCRGEFDLLPGWLAYVGSARGAGGLAARLARHQRYPRPLRWHVDFLLPVARPVAAWWAVGTERRECLWAATLARMPGASRLIPGFGASDCRCPGHLIHLPAPPEDEIALQTIGVPLAGNPGSEVSGVTPLGLEGKTLRSK